MAKRFFYVSMGILALVVAYNLGARSAEADWDPGGTGAIMGLDNMVYWDRSGDSWMLYVEGQWNRREDYDLPVPAGEVRFISKSDSGFISFVTNSGDVWIGSHAVPWFKADPFPGSSTPVTESSWGDVKRKFR